MDGPSNSLAGIHPARAVWCNPPAGGPYRVLKNMCSVCCSSVFSPSLFPSVASAPFFNFSDIQKGRRLGIDETTKSAPYSLLYVFRKSALCFSSKRHHTARSSSQVLFGGVQVAPDVESPPKYLFKILFFLKAKKTQQPGTVSVQLTISELLRFSGMSLHLGYLFKIFRLRLIYISFGFYTIYAKIWGCFSLS